MYSTGAPGKENRGNEREAIFKGRMAKNIV